MKETWKDMPGTDYSVSDGGKVMSHKRGRDKIMRLWHTERGYLAVRLCLLGGKRRFPVHRLVAEAFLGPPPSVRHEVNHKNGVKDDNSVVNLEWVTPSENMRHSVAVLGNGYGRNVSKLTLEQVREIRSRLGAGGRSADIAKTYKVTARAIRYIACGQRWGETA